MVDQSCWQITLMATTLAICWLNSVTSQTLKCYNTNDVQNTKDVHYCVDGQWVPKELTVVSKNRRTLIRIRLERKGIPI